MIYKLRENRVWRTYTGGKRLDRFIGKEVCESSHFPEDWTASVVKAFNPGREEICEGIGFTADGKPISDLIDSMSILVKLLDADERLVIQAHPTIPFAKKYFGSPYGKAECWYFLEAEKDACVYLGFKQGISTKLWKELFEKQDISAMLNKLHKIPVKKGDCIFVDGGVPHAIGGGCLMTELQEPTDLMVIPERITPAGINLTDAKLHGGLGFDLMFDCFEYKGYTQKELCDRYIIKPRIVDEITKIIIGTEITDKFSMEEICVNGKTDYMLKKEYAVAIILEGSGLFGETEVSKGDRLFIKQRGKVSLCGKIRALICLP